MSRDKMKMLRTVMTKGDELSPVKLYDPFLTCSHIVAWQIKTIVPSLPQNLQPPIFQGSRFRVRGSRLPRHYYLITRSSSKQKIQIKIQVFIPQNSRATKLTYVET